MTKLETLKSSALHQNAQTELLVSIQESLDKLSQRLDEVEINIKAHRDSQTLMVNQGFSKALEPVSTAVARLSFKEALEPLQRAVAQLSTPQAPMTPPKPLPLLLAYLGPRRVYLGLALMGIVLVLSQVFMVGQRSTLNDRVETLSTVVLNHKEAMELIFEMLNEIRAPKQKAVTRATAAVGTIEHKQEIVRRYQEQEAANLALGQEATNRAPE